LYGVASTQACCQACQGFKECSFFSYTKDSTSSNYQQCVIKSSAANVASTTTTSVDSGSRKASYSRPTTCSQVSQNTDFFYTSLKSHTAASSGDCCTLCTNYPGCNYWTYSGNTCYLKANQGNVTAAEGVVSGSVIPKSTVSTSKRTGKKGFGVYGTYACSDINLLGEVAWAYNWDSNPGILEECFDQLGIQYIPMIWGSTTDFSTVYSNSPYLLTFNEPNFQVQSNLSPAEAAALWPQVEAVAAKNSMKISSPSASYGGDTDPITWLQEFFLACPGCKVDFITTHQYDCTPANLHGAITNFYQFNLPVWVTEFSCYGSTVDQDVAFVNTTIPLFEGDKNISMYAWFGSRTANSGSGSTGTNDVFDHTSNALTSVGVAYAGGPRSSSASIVVSSFFLTFGTLLYLLL